jgi:hypothetical protein
VGKDLLCARGGVIDTACTIDERFEQDWQPLKGIFINYPVPLQNYIILKGLIDRERRTTVYCIATTLMCTVQCGPYTVQPASLAAAWGGRRGVREV